MKTRIRKLAVTMAAAAVLAGGLVLAPKAEAGGYRHDRRVCRLRAERAADRAFFFTGSDYEARIAFRRRMYRCLERRAYVRHRARRRYYRRPRFGFGIYHGPYFGPFAPGVVLSFGIR